MVTRNELGSEYRFAARLSPAARRVAYVPVRRAAPAPGSLQKP